MSRPVEVGMRSHNERFGHWEPLLAPLAWELGCKVQPGRHPDDVADRSRCGLKKQFSELARLVGKTLIAHVSMLAHVIHPYLPYGGKIQLWVYV